MSEKKKWLQVGGIWKSKNNPKKKHIILKSTPELLARLKAEDSVILFYEKPEEKYKRFVDRGFMEESEYEQKVELLPENLVFEITLPPEQD